MWQPAVGALSVAPAGAARGGMVAAVPAADGLAALALKARRPNHEPLLWWQPHLPSPPPLPLLLWCPPPSV